MPEYKVIVKKEFSFTVSAVNIKDVADALVREISRDFNEWEFDDDDWKWEITNAEVESPEYIIDNKKIIHVDNY